MEQKLAEFRARRKVGNAAKKTECTDQQSKTVPDTTVLSASTSDSTAVKQATDMTNYARPLENAQVVVSYHLIYVLVGKSPKTYELNIS